MIPLDVARLASAPASEPDARERLAEQVTERSLDRVRRVILLLMAHASVADPATRCALMGAADELDTAVRAARDVLPSRSRPL